MSGVPNETIRLQALKAHQNILTGWTGQAQFAGSVMGFLFIVTNVYIALFSSIGLSVAFMIYIKMDTKTNKTLDTTKKMLQSRWTRSLELEFIIFTEIFLGAVFITGLSFFFKDIVKGPTTALTGLKLYSFIMAYYYKNEGLFVLKYHVDEFNWSSYLLYHSGAYTIAFTIALVEFFLEYFFFPSFKELLAYRLWFIFFGIVSVSGLHLRHLSFREAGSNFHHLIRWQKTPSHKLVTSGVYSLDRHPSYSGYFFFSLASQIILMNPISFLIYFLALKKFFTERVQEEEESLEMIFGEEYQVYKGRVGCPWADPYGKWIDKFTKSLNGVNQQSLPPEYSYKPT